MRKKPSISTLRVVTFSDSSKVILKKTKSPILYIKVNNSECRILISQNIQRTDLGEATITLNNLNKSLAEFVVDEIDNNNIEVSCLGKRGLHLNNTRTSKIALNFIIL